LYQPSLVTSEELQTHQGEVEPHPKVRCPVSPETPPRSAQGSSEQELQHHTSSEEAERSLQEVVDALQEGIKQQSDPRGWWAARTRKRTEE
uniref:Uncharacterized protein n=1 Tax=Astatotilapia calliptera TaxID=8154 RepID=A0AAX7SXD7_ASTCA